MESLQNYIFTREICINCGICVKRLERHLVLELDTRVITLISEWISPRIILENDYICEACRSLIMRNVNLNLTEDKKALIGQVVGHTRVCIMCGKSILNLRSKAILRDHPTPTQEAIANILSALMPHELSASSRSCQSCWLRLTRVASRQQENETAVENKPMISTDQSSSTSIPITEEPSTTKAVERHATGIKLNNYRRAANTARHCVFPGCDAKIGLHRISDELRAQVLRDHKFYLPCHVRVCDDHLRTYSWDTLYESDNNSHSSFEPEHIEHVFSFLKR